MVPKSTETGEQGLEARIDALEMRVAYQDRMIDDLNTVIVAQWSKIDQALGLIARLEARLRDAQEGAEPEGEPDRRPPHY